MEKKFVPTADLSGKFRSKQDLYKVLYYDMQFYLPTQRSCPAHFIKQIFNGDKKAFRRYEIARVEVSLYSELSIKSLWTKFIGNKTIEEYLPDLRENELPERQFFFGILSTLYPEETKEMFACARRNRSFQHADKNDDKIEMTDDIKKEIDEILSKPTTPGKALFMLKLKCEAGRKRKRPREFPANLAGFEQIPNRARRLIRKQQFPKRSSFINRDEQMQYEEEEKKNIDEEDD